MGDAVCYHGRRKCVFCGVDPSRPRAVKSKPKPRCPCCGRFVTKHDRRCDRCKMRGFLAIRLFPVAA